MKIHLKPSDIANLKAAGKITGWVTGAGVVLVLVATCSRVMWMNMPIDDRYEWLGPEFTRSESCSYQVPTVRPCTDMNGQMSICQDSRTVWGDELVTRRPRRTWFHTRKEPARVQVRDENVYITSGACR